MSMITKFEELSNINVNEFTKKKGKLTYLSWAWAWGIFKKRCPSAKYEIKPWVLDGNLGYMVFTAVTVDEETHEMWLPVMNSSNDAMKNVAYSYKTKYGEKTVEPATMFDINTSIMRCLVKNLAMFGLGLYIYAGEDVPDTLGTPEIIRNEPIMESISEEDTKQTLELARSIGLTESDVTKWISSKFGKQKLQYLTQDEYATLTLALIKKSNG